MRVVSSPNPYLSLMARLSDIGDYLDEYHAPGENRRYLEASWAEEIRAVAALASKVINLSEQHAHAAHKELAGAYEKPNGHQKL
jgi:hypothetical protein